MILSLQEKREKINDEMRAMEEAGQRIMEELECKCIEANAEKQIFEEEVEKYRRMKESEKAMKLAAMVELDRRESASEEKLAFTAREYGIEETLRFLKKLAEHADGSFTLQAMHRRFYSGSEVLGAAERVSVADFVMCYPEMKEKNMLGYEYRLSVIGTPPLFCLDGISKAQLERMRADGMPPFPTIEVSPGSYQAWIELNSDDKTISSETWKAIKRPILKINMERRRIVAIRPLPSHCPAS